MTNKRSDIKKSLKEFYNNNELYLQQLITHNEAYLKSYTKNVIDFIEKVQITNCHLLDIGCGTGLSSYLFSQNTKSTIGIDISDKFIKYAKNNYNKENLVYITSDAANMPFEDCKFDIVCSYEFIEHVPDVEIVLHEIMRVTKKNGYIIIIVPNLCSLYTPIKDLLGLIFTGKGREVWAPNILKAIDWLFKNIFITLKNRILLQPNFIYRTPDLSDKCIGGDADAVYYANPLDLIRYFKRRKYKIINPYKRLKGKIFNLITPIELRSGQMVIAQKLCNNSRSEKQS